MNLTLILTIAPPLLIVAYIIKADKFGKRALIKDQLNILRIKFKILLKIVLKKSIMLVFMMSKLFLNLRK